ncbi:protein EPIDERMAL PATTERNING FACTOR 2-like [Dendrobium catenatum]|uniref:protein EPIDERMAL PATTERNING FACTOR 2-like n=1 Tax=Dendrobium catenatum TaxID=906689 RepID=UPI0010A03E63|nr:protein EPIDERMAL PATTERNING FACTOR 2-like [Dendrobium catenatum]
MAKDDKENVISELFQVQKEGDEDPMLDPYATGSSLPDCSHACGPCFPCKRVMVSFKCSIAESCPIVYRCMCKGKYYHVPSN